MNHAVILNRLSATEYNTEHFKTVDHLRELTIEKLKLLNDFKIALAVEKSEKNYIIVIESKDKELKIFESDNSMSVYDIRNIENLSIYKTKKHNLAINEL